MKLLSGTICDERLPHLEALLDTAHMRALLADTLFATAAETARYSITDCEILQCRFKPGKNCLVSFTLTINDNTSGQIFTHIVYAKTYPQGTSGTHYLKALKQNYAAPSFGHALIYLPAHEIVIWSFPCDRKLASLPDVMNAPQLQQEILPTVIAQSFGADWEILALRSGIVHYVAEHTCTIKVGLTLRQPARGITQSLSLFGKTYYNEQGARTISAMQYLQKAGVQIAPPLCYQPEIKTLWQRGLIGQTLNEQLPEGEKFMASLQVAAASVAKLHNTAVPNLPKITVADWLEKLRYTASLIAQIKPAYQTRCEGLVDYLSAHAPTSQSRSAVTLHGDLHLKNFFRVHDQVVLIDLDNLTSGDPLFDLSSFVANLHHRALLREIADPFALSDAFLEAYQTSVGWQIAADDLRWFVVAALLNERVARCITRLKAMDLLDDLFTLAERISKGEMR